MKAALYKTIDSGRIQCRLCHHFCRMTPGQTGLCGVRRCAVVNGVAELHTLVYEKIAACHADPVEKKPLYHYLPGSLTLSFGTMGCNLDCAWCQNDGISRFPAKTGRVEGQLSSPSALVDMAIHNKCRSISFTYTEPTVFFELMKETARLATERGLGTIMVSNGFQSPHCLKELAVLIQAANIDIKTFRDSTYRRYCQGKLKPVLDNVKQMKEYGWWLEITTLVVPGVNDDPKELKELAGFIQQELGPDTPWHLSAFHPCRDMKDRQSTPVSTLTKALEIGHVEGLRYVYAGNTARLSAQDTICPHCGRSLVNRIGFAACLSESFLGTCPACDTKIAGKWI